MTNRTTPALSVLAFAILLAVPACCCCPTAPQGNVTRARRPSVPRNPIKRPAPKPEPPTEAMVRVAVYDDSELVTIPDWAEIWFRGHGSWRFKRDSLGGIAAKNLGTRPIGELCEGDAGLVIYPNGREGVGDLLSATEIKVPIKMTADMDPAGSLRDMIHVSIGSEYVEVTGLPIQAATGEGTLRFER